MKVIFQAKIMKYDIEFYYIPRFNEVEMGVYWFHLVCLSVSLSVHLWTE